MINDDIFDDISEYLRVFPEENPNVSVSVRTGYWNPKDKIFSTTFKVGGFTRAHKATIIMRRGKAGKDIESIRKSLSEEAEITSSILNVLSRVRSLGVNISIGYNKSATRDSYDVLISTDLNCTQKDKSILLSKEEDKKLMLYARKIGNLFFKEYEYDDHKYMTPRNTPSVRKGNSSYIVSHVAYGARPHFCFSKIGKSGVRENKYVGVELKKLDQYQKGILELNKEKLEKNELYNVEYDESSMNIIVKMKSK